jgi:hypothetical protein
VTDRDPIADDAAELLAQLRAERVMFRAAVRALRAEFLDEIASLRRQLQETQQTLARWRAIEAAARALAERGSIPELLLH